MLQSGGTTGAGWPSRNHTRRRTKAGTASAVSLIQYWTAWTKVIERIPPAPTAAAMTVMTTNPPTHDGAPVTRVRVRLAPWNCGTR